MTTSSSDNFSVNRNDILTTAGKMAGVLGIGRAMESQEVTDGSLLLNLIVKQLMGKPDQAPGFKVWTRKRAYLFPQLNTSDYTLGTSSDHATASYVSTTTDAAEASGQTVISVTSTSGFTNGDNIGIIVDDNTIHWSTISSFVTDDTVTIADALDDTAASGSTVYVYTNKISQPLEMISVRRMDTNSNEQPLDRMTLMEYEEGLLKKNDSGDPSRYIYERGITTGDIKFDYQVINTTDIYKLTYLRPIEDFDAATDTPDFPQEYFRALVGQLAMDWATLAGKPVTQEMKLYRDEAYMIAGNLDAETTEVYFRPET